jgi:Fe-S oxidoreductase
MFGPVVYEAFRQVKRAFDPENVLNPGKVVDAPAMEQNLRVPPGKHIPDPPTTFDYMKQGGFFASVELCNGAGVCRKTQGGAMCPSYRVTKDERDTTRARANALRLEMTADLRSRDAESSERSAGVPAERWVADVMDLCLSCKACKSECPSNVDVAKLKAEFQHAFYEHRVRPLSHVFLKNIHRLSPLAARWAGINNWLGRRKWLRRVMESLAGIDRRRSLPELHRKHFRKWFSSRRRTPGADAPGSPGGRVVLLDDCFTTFQEPQIGRAAVTLLERAGFTVELAGICCGRAMISKGFLVGARQLAREGIAKLDRLVAAGVPILGLEPSCILTLADEWPELVPGAAAKRVAAAAVLADEWLARTSSDNGLSLGVPSREGTALFHGHCHQKALVGVKGTEAALRLVPGLQVSTLDAGCCGMAGAFGYEADHFDVSVAVANLELIPALRANPDALVIATGTSCRHQIRDLTGRRALHPLEVLVGDT